MCTKCHLPESPYTWKPFVCDDIDGFEGLLGDDFTYFGDQPSQLVELIKEHGLTSLNQQDAGNISAATRLFAATRQAVTGFDRDVCEVLDRRRSPYSWTPCVLGDTEGFKGILGEDFTYFGDEPAQLVKLIKEHGLTSLNQQDAGKNTAFAIRYAAMIAGGESPTAAAAVIEETREKLSEAHSFAIRSDAMIKDGFSPTAAAAVIKETRKKMSEAHSHSATQVNAARFNELILMGFIPSVA